MPVTNTTPEIAQNFAGASEPSVTDERLTLAMFHPSPGYVIVEPLPPTEESAGGIVFPESWRREKSVGWVRAAHSDDNYTVGTLVMLLQHAGESIELGGREYRLVSVKEEIVGRFEVVDIDTPPQ